MTIGSMMAPPKCSRRGSQRSSFLAAVEPCLFCGAPPESVEEQPDDRPDDPEPGWSKADLGRRRCVTTPRPAEGRAADAGLPGTQVELP